MKQISVVGGFFDQGLDQAKDQLAAPEGGSVSGLSKGALTNIPNVPITPWRGVEGGVTPQYKSGLEFKAGDYRSLGLGDNGAYFDKTGQTAIPLNSEAVYRNTPTPTGRFGGLQNKFIEAKDPLAHDLNFKDTVKRVGVPGLSAEDWANTSQPGRESLWESIYNPEYAATLKGTGNFNPQMQKSFEALARGEKPDVGRAYSPLTIGNLYTAPDKGYTRGGYTYGGFKDFGDTSSFGDAFDKKRKNDEETLRDKSLGTTDYYDEASKGKFKPYDTVYAGQFPESRGGSQGDPRRLEEFFKTKNWDTLWNPKSWF